MGPKKSLPTFRAMFDVAMHAERTGDELRAQSPEEISAVLLMKGSRRQSQQN